MGPLMFNSLYYIRNYSQQKKKGSRRLGKSLEDLLLLLKFLLCGSEIGEEGIKVWIEKVFEIISGRL